MARQYESSNFLSITRMRKTFAKRAFYIILTVVFSLSLVAYFGSGQMGGGQEASREYQEQPVVTVNGEKVPRMQYAQLWDQYKQFSAGNPTQALSFQGMVLNQIVDNAMQRALAKQRGLTVSDADIDKAILEQKKQIGGGKPISEDEFRETLKMQGVTIGDFREELSERLLPQKLQEQVGKQVVATEKELRESHNEVKLRHILVDTKKIPEAQAKSRVDKILNEVRAGGNFAKLADEYTDDSTNRPQKFDEKQKKMVPSGPGKGGDLGWTKVGSLGTTYVPQFAEAAKKLEAGQISEPVKTTFGYHIIKLEEKRSNLPKDFEKNKTKLLEDYKNQQVGQKFQLLMDEERKKAKIVWHDAGLEWRYAYAKTNPMMGMITPDSQGGAAELEKKLREYLKSNASDSEAALVLGKQIYQNYLMTAPGPQREKLRDEVIKYYEMALSGSEDRDTRMTTAQLYRDAGKKDLALKQYRTVQRLLRWDDSPMTKSVHTQLQTAFKELGDKESAEKSAKRIIELTAIEKKQEEERKVAEARAKEEAKKAAEKAKEDARKKAAASSSPASAKDGAKADSATDPAAPATSTKGPAPSATGKTSTQPGHEGHSHP